MPSSALAKARAGQQMPRVPRAPGQALHPAPRTVPSPRGPAWQRTGACCSAGCTVPQIHMAQPSGRGDRECAGRARQLAGPGSLVPGPLQANRLWPVRRPAPLRGKLRPGVLLAPQSQVAGAWDPGRCNLIRDGTGQGQAGKQAQVQGVGKVWGDPAHLDPAAHCFLGRQHGVPKPSHCPHDNYCELRTSGYSQQLPRAYHCPVSQMTCQRLREGTADPVSQPGRGSSWMQTPMLSAPDPSPGPGLPQHSKKGAPALAHPPAGRPLAQACPGLASKEAPGSERNRD